MSGSVAGDSDGSVPAWAADLRVGLARVETTLRSAIDDWREQKKELRELKEQAATRHELGEIREDVAKLRAEINERDQARARRNRWAIGAAIGAAGTLAAVGSTLAQVLASTH